MDRFETINALINKILPSRTEKYTLDEINQCLQTHQAVIELEQRQNNDKFDAALGTQTIANLQNLNNSISELQLAILRLQCDISYAKEQYNIVESIRENPIIKERCDMLNEERKLKKSLQQFKFKPILDFFELYANHLQMSVAGGQKLCTTVNQLFDWTQYHYIVLLLRACGKALMDIDGFESLYQSELDVISLTFKQPLESMQFNNFIEYYDTFSLETQLVLKMVNEQANNRKDISEYQLLGDVLNRIKEITIECCKLVLDLNMSYIEAHLTEGINIDRLNGTENLVQPQEDTSLPLYALSPQEYITQIGQHLLTLRKRTQPFDTPDNRPLLLGLQSLPTAQDIPLVDPSCQSATEIIMRSIARLCIRSLIGRTSNSIVTKLTPRGKRQLATDALYLDNVLEDLKLLDTSEQNVTKFKSLLQTQ